MATTPTAPTHREHHGRLVWRTRWYDDTGKRRDKLFGPVSKLTRREVMQKYRIWLTDWTNDNRVRNPKATLYTYTVSDLAVDYREHAARTFTKHGRRTTTVYNVNAAMQALEDTFGDQPAANFEGPDLVLLRDSLIRREDGHVRAVKTVNDRLYLIKQAFRWAREGGRVPKDNLFDLMNVKPLRAGRCEAKAAKPVLPVEEHWVAVAKAHAPKTVGAMIDLQWLTGMRPGDVCLMRPIDIDTTGDVWLYKPHEHKTEHLGRVRIIPLGPRAKEIIRPFLCRDLHAYCFSPAEAHTERAEARRKKRKTPLYPSHLRRYATQNRNRVRPPGDHYDSQSYRRAIHYACSAAEREAQKHDPKAEVPRWNPHQLRHAAATRLNKQFGLEDVSVTLGHASIETTRIYAQPDVSRAIRIAQAVG